METAFTTKYNRITRVLFTEIEISLPTDDNNIIGTCNKYKCRAIWDTGATSSAITQKVANHLELKPTSMVQVNTAGGLRNQNVYFINIYLPNKLVVPFVNVTECMALSTNSIDNFEVLIGMDIISQGDFTVTNKNNETWLSFRYPSLTQTDYVKDIDYKNKHIQGRNEKCYCGSGLKFKKCHGK